LKLTIGSESYPELNSPPLKLKLITPILQLPADDFQKALEIIFKELGFDESMKFLSSSSIELLPKIIDHIPGSHK